jgi:hypothetical protein
MHPKFPPSDGISDDESDVIFEASTLPQINWVSINLAHYDGKIECFSEWDAKQLKSFTKITKIMKELSVNQFKNSSYCEMHKGISKVNKFQRPPNISDELKLYELKPNDKSRLHGFFLHDVFYLLWLDRNHLCFPSK